MNTLEQDIRRVRDEVQRHLWILAELVLGFLGDTWYTFYDRYHNPAALTHQLLNHGLDPETELFRGSGNSIVGFTAWAAVILKLVPLHPWRAFLAPATPRNLRRASPNSFRCFCDLPGHGGPSLCEFDTLAERWSVVLSRTAIVQLIGDDKPWDLLPYSDYILARTSIIHVPTQRVHWLERGTVRSTGQRLSDSRRTFISLDNALFEIEPERLQLLCELSENIDTFAICDTGFVVRCGHLLFGIAEGIVRQICCDVCYLWEGPRHTAFALLNDGKVRQCWPGHVADTDVGNLPLVSIGGCREHGLQGNVGLRCGSDFLLWHPSHGQLRIPLPETVTPPAILGDERLVYVLDHQLFLVC